MTSFTPRKPRSASERRNAIQNGSASDAPAATAQHLAPPIRVHAHRDYHSHRDNPARLARLQVRRVDPQIGPGALDGAAKEGIHALVDLRTQPRDLAFGDAGRAHGFDEIVDGP